MAGPRQRKPVIGVTGPDRGGAAAWLFTRLAIWRAGGRAVRLTPARPLPAERLEGLVLGGGADVDPALYGEARESLLEELTKGPSRPFLQLVKFLLFPIVYLLRKVFSTKRAAWVDRQRDQLETEALTKALHQGLPVLGICRGAQLLNVVLGGTLHQDLREYYVETPQVHTVLPKKPIFLAPQSRVAAIYGRQRLLINGLHRQAIKRTGKGLLVVGWEKTGVVQAVEHASEPFLIGVQWHPEYLPQYPEQQALFQALVHMAARRQSLSRSCPGAC